MFLQTNYLTATFPQEILQEAPSLNFSSEQHGKCEKSFPHNNLSKSPHCKGEAEVWCTGSFLSTFTACDNKKV